MARRSAPTRETRVRLLQDLPALLIPTQSSSSTVEQRALNAEASGSNPEGTATHRAAVSSNRQDARLLLGRYRFESCRGCHTASLGSVAQTVEHPVEARTAEVRCLPDPLPLDRDLRRGRSFAKAPSRVRLPARPSVRCPAATSERIVRTFSRRGASTWRTVRKGEPISMFAQARKTMVPAVRMGDPERHPFVFRA